MVSKDTDVSIKARQCQTSTYGSTDFRDHWYWESDLFDTGTVRYNSQCLLKRHLFNRVLGITESGFSGTRVLKLTDLVSRTTESGFTEFDWLPVQCSTLACTVFMQTSERIDTGAQFRDRANTRAPWTLGLRHS